MASEKQKLLRRLQAARFAVIEANIYLDSHPTCQEGLRYFREKRDELNKLTEEYQENYGPITAGASVAEERWDWVSTAFPWERGES
jgi:spore coat protein JB